MKRVFSPSVLASIIMIIITGLLVTQVSMTQAVNTSNFKEGQSIKTIKNINIKKLGFTCGDQILDRDGYTYTTVQIGTQCWMGENLKTKTKPDSTPLTNLSDGSERDCSNTMGVHGTETDCDAGNAIYTWDATMNGSNIAGDQGLCMTGWHVPTDEEWASLETYLTSSKQTCNPNRLNSFDCADAGSDLLPNGSADFNSTLAGVRYTDNLFSDIFVDFDYGAYFWSSTRNDTDVYARNVNTDENRVWRGAIDVSDSSPQMSLSVRCIKN